MDSTLDQALEQARKSNTVAQSIIALLKEIVAGEKLSPTMQAKVNAIVEADKDTEADIANAVLENTPQAPSEPIEPTEPSTP